MSTAQLITRTIACGLLLGVVDAVGGRLLQAAPDPTISLSLAGTAWVAYGLAQARRTRVAFPAAIAFWLAFFVAFLVCAYLLIGWNGSTPWHPRSARWMVYFAISVPIVAVVAQALGARAATRAATTGPTTATPNEYRP